jgi:uncharacterized protein (UPF0332 family)
MPTTWHDLIALADWLATNAGGESFSVPVEAARRDSISRAYYSAFHAAQDLIVRRDNFQPPQTGSVHEEVLRAFRHPPAPSVPRQQIAVWLDRLRNQRVLADYRLTADVSADLVSAALRNARDIHQHVARLQASENSSNPDAERITTSMS